MGLKLKSYSFYIVYSKCGIFLIQDPCAQICMEPFFLKLSSYFNYSCKSKFYNAN